VFFVISGRLWTGYSQAANTMNLQGPRIRRILCACTRPDYYSPARNSPSTMVSRYRYIHRGNGKVELSVHCEASAAGPWRPAARRSRDKLLLGTRNR
jgi:hypothetical protein